MHTTYTSSLVGPTKRSEGINLHARQIWNAYIDHIELLEPDLKAVAASYVKERDYSETASPPINLLVPILLAQVFGVTDHTLIEKVAIATLSLDHCSHLLDDATDSPSSISPLQCHLSHLLLSRATSSLLSLSCYPATFSHWFDRYLMEAMKGERALWSHRKAVIEYTQTDYSSLTSRGSLIKVCAAMYADLTDRWQLLDSIEKGLGAASVGTQLIDDVLDWQDDLYRGIYTQPLVAAFRIVSVERALNDPAAINRAIVLDGVADDVIRRAADYFDHASSYFEQVDATNLKVTTTEFANGLRELLLLLAEARVNPAVVPDFRTMLQTRLVIRMQH